MSTKHKVIEFYNRLYGQRKNSRESLVVEWARKKELNAIFRLIKREDIVLDVGCGNGEPSLLWAKKAKRVIGFDISKEAIKMAKQKLQRTRFKNCHFFQGDIENVQYPKDSIDTVLCVGVFEYFSSIDIALKCIYKILRRGGRLYFHVWNRESIMFTIKRLFGLLDKNKPFNRHFFTYAEIVKSVHRCGFALENSYGQFIANKFFSLMKLFKIELRNKKIFYFLENQGRNILAARFLADNLVFIAKKP